MERQEERIETASRDHPSCRTIAEIDAMIHQAKLNPADLAPTSQIIYFSESDVHHNDKFKFLELDDHLLNTLKAGETLYIKGDDDDNVVLCTDTQTYEVTGGETSDSLLLTKNMQFFDNVDKDQRRRAIPIEVVGIFNEYLSINPAKLHLKKLLALLNKSLYEGPENEHNVSPDNLYTYEQLNATIQMCTTDLKNTLDEMPVVKIDGKIRLLDCAYHFRVLSLMLNLIDENSWSLDEIDYDETLNALQDLVPDEILVGLFDKYTVESKIIDGLQLYQYNEFKVCQFVAEALVYTNKLLWSDFFATWAASVPEGMQVSEEMLHGIAIDSWERGSRYVQRFPEEQLPDDIHERFNVLFRVKEKWTVPQITPYIRRLATKKTDVNALLAKFARVSTVKGVKYYSAKHSK